MRLVKKVLLTILAVLPVASISTVAHCKLIEMAGEDQNDTLTETVRDAHRLLFPPMTVTTSIEDAKKRIADQTGINDPQALDQEFHRNVQILRDKGMIETNEINCLSHGPSQW